ncbi:hypothetical protein [Haloarcula brevis]|uniref:hypothetical protein n=1 Tax=Haloarcula brevis TaxID=3111453 RepID=UPI00300F73F7
MARDPLLTSETKVTLAFMFVGLTAWYAVRLFTANDLLEMGALFGVGIVLPTLVNELRRRRDPD